MKQLSKITMAGALVCSLIAAAHAQSATSSDTSDTTNQPLITDSNNANTTTNTSSQSNPAQTPKSTAQTTNEGQGKDGSLILTPDNIQWKNAPAMMPPGAQVAILEGNPKGKGTVTLRIKVPANYQVPPVYLKTAEAVTVLSGAMNLGIGDKLDTNAGTALPAGSFVVLPAYKHHYVWASEDSVVQMSGKGPWIVKYVNAKDDPRNNTSNQNKTDSSGSH